MKCKNCGAELDPGTKFCTKCGAKVESASDASTQGNDQPVSSTSNNQAGQPQKSVQNSQPNQTQQPNQAMGNNNQSGQNQFAQTNQNGQQGFNQNQASQQNMSGQQSYNQNPVGPQNMNDQQNYNQNQFAQQNMNGQQNFNQTQAGQLNSNGQPNFNQNQNEPMQNNQTFENFKKHSSNYFAWFVNSLKRPSQVDQKNKFFGLISFAINSVLMAWILYLLVSRVFQIVTDMIQTLSEQFGSSSSYYDSSDTISGGSIFLIMLITVIICFAVFLGVGFLCKKFLAHDEPSMLTYANTLGSYSNSMIAVEVVTVLFLLIALPRDLSISIIDSIAKMAGVALLLIGLIMIIFSIAFIASLVNENGRTSIDGIYVALIGYFASNVVMAIVFRIVFNGIFSDSESMGMIVTHLFG